MLRSINAFDECSPVRVLREVEQRVRTDEVLKDFANIGNRGLLTDSVGKLVERLRDW